MTIPKEYGWYSVNLLASGRVYQHLENYLREKPETIGTKLEEYRLVQLKDILVSLIYQVFILSRKQG